MESIGFDGIEVTWNTGPALRSSLRAHSLTPFGLTSLGSTKKVDLPPSVLLEKPLLSGW